MANPYEPLAVEDDRFHFVSALGLAVRFAGVGLLVGAGAGYQLEQAVNLASSTALLMGAPGITFGIGITVAAVLFVPGIRKAGRLSRRRMRLVALPVLALLGFCVIGVAYDYVENLTLRRPVNRVEYLNLWVRLFVAVLPGVAILGLGTLLIARPRSFRRFGGFLLITAALAGAAPIVTAANAWGFVEYPFFATMFVGQLSMFTMLGWIFGDSRASADGLDSDD